ncbi:MAG: hypothetical protein M0Q91_18735 [Methanoregula sp.]|jgi:hypothetical protein|nr:hypothetical protein [Methanoregula sp.]
MTKENRQDVYLPCFGNIKGCLVNHCTVSAYCYQHTKKIEAEEASKEQS